LAALEPKRRADQGQPRKLTAPQQKWILEQSQTHLAVPVQVLYRRWREQDPQWPALHSIYRFLREHELHTKARRQPLRPPLGGATQCFEAPFVHDLRMTDFSPGPFLHPADAAKAIPTFLCVISDDHSRLIPSAADDPRADPQAFQQTLKEALRRRGRPAKLYTDQGGPFTNDHTRVVGANLGVRRLHAKPHHAGSKGKAERVLFTIPQDFEAGLRLPGQGAGNLEELNAQFSFWLQSVYHARVHWSLSPWTAPLVSQYVQQSLAAVGVTRQAIEPAALNLLTSASSGLARSLCLLCRAAWIEAASAGDQIIQPPHVQAAIERVPGAAGLLPSPAAPTTA
jgi:transposase InsO family protein